MEYIPKKKILEKIKKSWGNGPHGLTEDLDSGTTRVVTFVPTLGRRFIRGREIWHDTDITYLCDGFFLPPGEYAGVILR